ncbi:MAG: hydrolase, partial [Sneathiella sp.]
MDSVTQFVLGASISGALLGPRIGAKSLLIGGLVATLPDLDSFIPLDNAIDNMTYHRGFSHSIIVQTLITPVVAFIIGKIIPSVWEDKKRVFLTVWLVLVTHSLLDSLTTYGTQIFWPLNVGPPV